MRILSDIWSGSGQMALPAHRAFRVRVYGRSGSGLLAWPGLSARRVVLVWVDRRSSSGWMALPLPRAVRVLVDERSGSGQMARPELLHMPCRAGSGVTDGQYMYVYMCVYIYIGQCIMSSSISVRMACPRTVLCWFGKTDDPIWGGWHYPRTTL